MRLAVALLVAGVGVAFVPGLAAGDRFVRVIEMWEMSPSNPPSWTRGDWTEVGEWPEVAAPVEVHNYFGLQPVVGTSASELVRSEVGWTVVAASMALVPVLFGWWRRAGATFVQIAGISCAVAAGASAYALVASMRGLSDLPDGVWWTVPLGGALMAAAFLVAPAPRVRDE